MDYQYHMADWNPELYLRFRAQRTQPTRDLVSRIQASTPRSILDVGCGPGNSTAVLKELYPKARILGIDRSESMIEAARSRNPDIEFLRLDASTELGTLGSKFDIVFSNACIQWIDHHELLIPSLYELLEVGGELLIQLPYNHTESAKYSIETVRKRESWRERIGDLEPLTYLSIPEYYRILSALSSDFDIFTITYVHAMPSVDAIVEWYRSTGLRPYIDALGPDAEAFIDEYRAELEKSYRPMEDGNVLFPFPRLFMTARRRM